MGLVIILTLPRVCADSIANFEDEEELGEHLEEAHTTLRDSLRDSLAPTAT